MFRAPATHCYPQTPFAAALGFGTQVIFPGVSTGAVLSAPGFPTILESWLSLLTFDGGSVPKSCRAATRDLCIMPNPALSALIAQALLAGTMKPAAAPSRLYAETMLGWDHPSMCGKYSRAESEDVMSRLQVSDVR